MKLYRLFLLAFPGQVRREFGDEMLRMFEAQLEAARTSGNSRLRLWISGAADAVVFGFGERFGWAQQPRANTPRGPMRWRSWMDAVRLDLRYAFRLFLAQPGVTLMAILTLALGTGANTAIFSAVDSVLLRPLPYHDPDRLVMVWEKRQSEGVLDNPVSPADYLDWERMHTAFESIAGFLPITVDLTGSGEPERLSAAGVSPIFFDLLGVRPALGRSFRSDEATVGQHRVVILTDGVWKRRFGGQASVVGQRILLSGIPHEVVGVLPPTFEFPDPGIEIWAPLALTGGPPPSRDSHFLTVYARMKPEVTIDVARRDMDRVGGILSQQYPQSNRTHGAWVTPLDERLRSPVQAGLLLLFGAVAFVLLIACVNVANLLLARAASRRREIALRAALGAGRARLAAQTLTESVALAIVGGAAGLLVAHWGIQLLRQLAPEDLPLLGLARMGLDVRVLVFTLALSVVTGLLFGILPAVHLAQQDLTEALQSGTRTSGGVRRRLRTTLVVSEIALASLLLAGAGLTWRSFQTLLRTEAGFSSDGVLTALITLPGARYRNPEQLLATFADIEQRLAKLPGVVAVGATSLLPLSGQDGRRGVGIEGREPTPDVPTRAHPRAITPDYFRAMDIRLISGRSFTPADRAGGSLVVIVNDTMARRYWPGQSPIGRRLQLGGTSDWREVVGIVRDVRHWGLDRDVNPEMYLPLPQAPTGALTFTIRTAGEPASLSSAVREQLRAVDPDLPLSNVRTMEQVAAGSVASRSASMQVLAIFGVLALVLAAAGIYGVMAHLVTIRSNEIGVRMTLGARPADVMRLVLREGVLQALMGLTLGLGAAILVMRAFRSMLYVVSPADPITLGSVAVLLLSTAVMACAVPARRAMNVDPASALKQ